MVVIHLSVEVPDVNAIMLAHCDHLRVVLRVEEQVVDLVGVADETLEEIWVRLLSLVVPYLYQVVFAT